MNPTAPLPSTPPAPADLAAADFSPVGERGRDNPQRDLAEGFAAHAADWARACGAPPEAIPALRQAARQLSLATAEGHVCLPLADLFSPAEAGDPDAARTRWRARLLASGVVAEVRAGHAPACPLLLDVADRLYLRRHYVWERRLAAALMARAGGEGREAAMGDGCDDGQGEHRTTAMPPPPAVAERLAQLFATNGARLGERADWQKLAVALALLRRLTLISGGPGTGKTTTVAALLACLLESRPDLRIALAAPTGKAAARMLEALRARAASLPEALQARLPREAHTLHRLLGVTPEPGRFRHHRDHPLALDVLVVDEASMLDLALATRLLDAMPADARLILLGDKDQLAAVEAGAVFAELSADPDLTPATTVALARLTAADPACIVPPQARRASPLRDAVVWFTESHRFSAESGIGRLAAGINGGAGEHVLGWLAQCDPAEGVAWLDDTGDGLGEAAWQRMVAGFAGYFVALRAHAAHPDSDPSAVFAAFERFRVLCAVHEGARGLAAINNRLQRLARDALARAEALFAAATDPASGPWFAGRPVIVLKNDYGLKLYNGDVGLCLPGADGLRVVFPAADGGWRSLAPARLPAHDTAFAMTVHKSQGSEFAEVLVILPATPTRVMTRELLYTAVTRASRQVTLAGRRDVFLSACATPTQRRTGLLDRLRELAPGSREGV
ncbi:MAG: exodeoxyribonuclease V subunit alpha [Rhodocyclaceae bacterium]